MNPEAVDIVIAYLKSTGCTCNVLVSVLFDEEWIATHEQGCEWEPPKNIDRIVIDASPDEET